VSFRTERSGVRNLYILKYQFVNQISRSARNDNQSYFAELYFIGTGKSFSQQKSDASKKKTDLQGLTGVSFQIQKIPDHWDIKYYGLAGEIVPKDLLF